MKKKNETKKITQGAMMVAILGVILLMNRQMGGIMEVSFYWVLSMPMIIYSAQVELKYSLIVLVSALLMSLMISTPQTIFYLFSALVLGVVYGAGIRNQWSNSRLLSWTMIVTLISEFLTMYVFASLFGYNLLETRAEFIQMIQALPVELPLSAELIFQVVDVLSFLMVVVFQSLCVHLLAHVVFVKMKLPIEPIRFLFQGVLPQWVGIGGIVSYFCFMGVATIEQQWIQLILTFLYCCFFIANFVYGMIVLRYMNQIPKILRFICVLIPFLWPMVMILGVMDALLKGKIKKGVF